jgi:hypothetical protein
MSPFPDRAIMARGGKKSGVLFAILYRWRANVRDDDTRGMRQLFVAWEPPTGLEVTAHYHYARGGGLAVVDTVGASTLFEALAPFTHTIDFDIEPIVNVIEAIAISMDVDVWVESVSNADDEPGEASSQG